MSSFVATFHTHLSAMLTCQTLTDKGISARMAPVPRKISSSCGTCVFYEAEDSCLDCLDEDTEAVYRIKGDTYEMIREQA